MNRSNIISTTSDDFKTMLDSMFDIIVITDDSGNYLYLSNSVKDLYNIGSEHFLGSSVYDLVNKNIFSPSVIIQTLKRKQPGTYLQKTITGKNLVVTSTPIFDEHGELSRIVTMGKDITELEDLNSELVNTKQYFNIIIDQQNLDKLVSEPNLESKNPHMIKTKDLIIHVAKFDTTILLLGDTGVGKSYYAKMIHELSEKKDDIFVQINCGAIPHDLLESELFGYEPGAFTGASSKGKIGLLELAKNGTVFLDEISELPKDIQVKLLHVLQERVITPIGGQKQIHINSRFITATNRDLPILVQTGEFREDLYYRINVIPIKIPPLRQRREDIVSFVTQTIEKMHIKYKIKKEFSNEALNALRDYDWPGNIRQLENVIERLIVTSIEDTIDYESVINALNSNTDNPGKMVTSTDKITPISAPGAFYPQYDIPLREQMENYERAIIAAALAKYHTTRKAAKSLNIDQSTLVKKIKRLNIHTL